MESKTILKEFREKVSEKINLKEKGIGRYLVITPFLFEDGDNLVIILKHDKKQNKWKLTDEGHTFMHLSYFMDIKDFQRGTRQEIINNCKMMFGVDEKEGELFLYVSDGKFGDSLFDFVQSLLKITDITFLERERTATTFFEDFKSSIYQITKKRKLKVEFDYYADKDKRRAYPIDARIKLEKKEIFIFAINSDNKCLNSAFSLLMFEKWGMNFGSIGVFEDQTEISRSVLAKFSDVCEKQITSLDQINRFDRYLENK